MIFIVSILGAVIGVKKPWMGDIRVGTITSVSEVLKSNKLMKLTVDFGDHTRVILAGIKKERKKLDYFDHAWPNIIEYFFTQI